MKPILVLLAGGHKAPPLVDIDNTVFIQFGIFLLLLLVLTRFVFRPYLAMKGERSRNIEGARTEAEELTLSAAEKLAGYEGQIAQARKETTALRATLRGEGEGQASTLLGDARSRAEAKTEAGRQGLEKSVQAAQLALRTRADQIARDIARKLLGREV